MATDFDTPQNCASGDTSIKNIAVHFAVACPSVDPSSIDEADFLLIGFCENVSVNNAATTETKQTNTDTGGFGSSLFTGREWSASIDAKIRKEKDDTQNQLYKLYNKTMGANSSLKGYVRLTDPALTETVCTEITTFNRSFPIGFAMAQLEFKAIESAFNADTVKETPAPNG